MKRKSIGTAILLTALLGPLGLVYVSIGQALLGVVLLFIGYSVVLSSTLDVSPISALGFFWLMFIAVAWSMTKRHNAEIDEKEALEERRHQEILSAMKDKN